MRSRRRTAFEEGSEQDREGEQRPSVRESPRRAAQRQQNEQTPNRIFLKTPVQSSKTDKAPKSLNTRISIKMEQKSAYPPKELDLPTTNAEKIAANISKASSAFLCEKWIQGTNSVLIDETKSIKYAVISIYIEKVTLGFKNCPPFLLIVQPDETILWYEQLKYWTTQKVTICSSDQSEREKITDQSLLYDINPTNDYGIVLVNYKQLIKDPSIIPYRQWASIIADEPSTDIPHEGLYAYHKTFVGNQYSDEYPSLEKFLEVPPDLAVDPTTIFTIAPEDAANDFLYEENFTPCPMAALQQSMYIEILTDYSPKLRENDCTIELMCEFAAKLRGLSTHPYLVTDTPCDIMSASGKVPVLSKLLSFQKQDSKRVGIICNAKSVTALHTIMTELKTTHVSVDSEIDENNLANLIEEFNEQQGHRVIIVPSNLSSLFLERFCGETIFAFDSDWTPVEDGTLIVKWHARNPKALIFRLITTDSFEYIAFSYFWHHRQIKPSDFDDPSKADPVVLKDLIKEVYRVAFNNLSVLHQMPRTLLREIKILPYSDTSVFLPSSDPFLEDYWTMPEKALAIHPPRQSRPLTPAQFWTEPRLQRYLQLLNLFGWGRWEKFAEFNRPEGDLQKLAVLFLKMLMKNIEDSDILYPNVHILIKENGKFDQKRLLTSLTAWSVVFQQATAEPLLSDVENNKYFMKLLGDKIPQSASEIDLSEYESDVQDVNETQNLLFEAFSEGVCSLSEEKQQIVRNLINVAKAKPPKVEKHEKKISTQISLRAAKTKFDGSSHEKVLNALMAFGFPSLDKFIQAAGLTAFASESVQNYVDNIINFCQTQTDDRRKFAEGFVKRIVKYHSQKIPLRLKLFERVRECKRNYDEFPAEDLEFLSAVASHGLALWNISPVLLCACRGQPTEAKLYNRVKLIFEESKRTKVIQRIPEDFPTKMPLRVNDLMMLRNIGEINPKFHDEDYVYPIGYHVSVATYSLVHQDTKVWTDCFIELKDDKLNFVVWPDGDENSKIEGSTPDEVFEIYRIQLSRFSGLLITYIDGHEMFGLDSPLVNILLNNMPNIDECEKFHKRYFSTVIPLTQKWPVIGQFEKEPEAMVIAQPKATVQPAPTPKSSPIHRKFKFKKRVFGDLPPPLVVDFNPLASDNSKRLSLDFMTGPSTLSLVDAYSEWSNFDCFLPVPE